MYGMLESYISLFTFLLAVIYLLIGLLLHLGLSKRYGITTIQPKVSVLIAARNEETFLPACLESLSNQDYPTEFLEIIIIDDHSTDQTAQIAQSFTNRFSYFKLLSIDTYIEDLKGKMNALAHGVEVAAGEIILVTDADCRVPKNWISTLTSYFDQNVGLVGALTLLKRNQDRESIFDHLQKFDWLFLQAIASGTAGIGLPVSVLGNNFGFKKSVYRKIGGFKNIKFSLTEDMALLNAIVKYTDYRVVYAIQHEGMILSAPLNNFSEFTQQRKRWVSGGQKAPLWGWILMITAFLAHLFLAVNLFLWDWKMTFILALICVLGTDYTLLNRAAKRARVSRVLIWFPLYELFYIVYTLIFSISVVLPGKIWWKGRDY
jgi:cellulose synthase/poly-beta-1,6-N-acetylglucosamine synthase-like glycosyltransferase